MTWLAIDVGGANLKLADGEGFARTKSFALWRYPERLADELQSLLRDAPGRGRLAVTMTGELADCFPTKAAGVRFILNAVGRAAADWQVRVYLTDGRLVTVDTAEREPLAAAASNWHALASYAARHASGGPALMFDIGSTTCDLVPLADGRVIAAGGNDTQRLVCGELVYTGIERSPVCAVAHRVPYREETCPPAQELFATMRDVYLVLGHLGEEPSCCETADGRPATHAAACRRLARVVCADPEQFTADDARILAEAVAASQADLVSRAFRQVVAKMPSPPHTVVASGHGDFLLHRVLAASGFAGRAISLSRRLGPAVARVATAHALAVLAREQVQP